MQGLGNFNVTNNAPFTAGPPFPGTAAENGLSVDGITGRIVLGNDVGGVTAQLLSVREIGMNGQILRFLNGVRNTDFFGSSIQLYHSVTPLQNGFISPGLFQVGADTTINNPASMDFIDGAAGGGTNTISQVLQELQIIRGVQKMLTLDQSFGIYRMGDIDGALSGIHVYIDAGPATFEIRNTLTNEYMIQANFGAATNLIGDIQNITTGAKELVNVAGSIHDFSNTALTAIYSCNGVAGVTGVFAPVNSITVNGGIVTGVT